MNKFELANDTLDLYFDTTRAETLKHLPPPHELVLLLQKKGADHPEDRVQAIEYIYGDTKWR
jgi:hypothetical protein